MVWRIEDTRDRFRSVGRFGVEADLEEPGRSLDGNVFKVQQTNKKKKRRRGWDMMQPNLKRLAP